MHVQLAIFLQAETKKWAVQFCRALHRGHPDLRAAWSLLQAENDHTVSVVISAHPLLNDQSAPLDHVLRELPPWLHEAAYKAVYVREGKGKQLEPTANMLARAKAELMLRGPGNAPAVTRAVVSDMTAQAAAREAALPQP